MSSLNTRTSTSAADVVAVLRQDSYEQVFPLARPVGKATAKVTSKLMEHPVEDGSTITDHRVILPVEIDMPLLLASEDYRSVYQSIRTLFDDCTLLIVQTRTGSYRNMVISDMPSEESADMLDAVPVALRLREVKLVKPQYGTLPTSKVKDPTNSSTVNRGEQQGSEADSSKKSSGSLLYQTFKK